MAKNEAGGAQRKTDIRDRSSLSGKFVDRGAGPSRTIDQKKPFKGVRREILFPTEPSTIGNERIDRAIERVISRKK